MNTRFENFNSKVYIDNPNLELAEDETQELRNIRLNKDKFIRNKSDYNKKINSTRHWTKDVDEPKTNLEIRNNVTESLVNLITKATIQDNIDQKKKNKKSKINYGSVITTHEENGIMDIIIAPFMRYDYKNSHKYFLNIGFILANRVCFKIKDIKHKAVKGLKVEFSFNVCVINGEDIDKIKSYYVDVITMYIPKDVLLKLRVLHHIHFSLHTLHTLIDETYENSMFSKLYLRQSNFSGHNAINKRTHIMDPVLLLISLLDMNIQKVKNSLNQKSKAFIVDYKDVEKVETIIHLYTKYSKEGRNLAENVNDILDDNLFEDTKDTEHQKRITLIRQLFNNNVLKISRSDMTRILNSMGVNSNIKELNMVEIQTLSDLGQFNINYIDEEDESFNFMEKNLKHNYGFKIKSKKRKYHKEGWF